MKKKNTPFMQWALRPSSNELPWRDHTSDNIKRWTRVLSIIFFFSGFPALIYQLVWQRALFRIFGVDIESVTIVVTAFMLGLGIGSLAGGWLSKRRGIPLMPLLAGIELSIALFGIGSLGLFERVGLLVIDMPLSVKAIVALALVAIPTLLMGATLPVMVGRLVNRSGNVGHSVGRLYYANTLGAGASCLLASALIFPFLGMQKAIYFAAAMNVAVAAGALVIYWRERRDEIVESLEREELAVAAPRLIFAPVLALAFAGGFISLSYEIFFVRTVSFADGGGAASFAVTLGAFLIGLASGSREAADWCTAGFEEVARRVTGSLIKSSVLGLLFLPLLAHAEWLHTGLLAIALAAVYLFARFWGTLLPCLAHFGVAPNDRAGTRTALIYFANIVGSASGGILTGFVLMNSLRLPGIAAVLVVAGLCCAASFACLLHPPGRSKWLPMSCAAAGTLAAVLLLPATTHGLLEALMFKGASGTQSHFVQDVENRSGIITVDDTGAVFGSGMYDGRFNTDLMNDTNGIVRPFALSLFHREPRDVLMIGLSSGSWAQVLPNNPEVRSLTVVEINPGYTSLIARTPEVASVLTNAKVRIVTDDGRRWLRMHPDRKFDAIVSNTTWYFRANAANLLSSEFLGLIRAHLNTGGVFFYNSTDSERVQRTACLAFPYGARFINHMLVSDSPLIWDFDNWNRTLQAYRIDGRPVFDLSRAVDRQRMGQFMALQTLTRDTKASGQTSVIEPCSRILERTADRMPVTDDNMGSEWRHGLGFE